jgi:hypothetical protein
MMGARTRAAVVGFLGIFVLSVLLAGGGVQPANGPAEPLAASPVTDVDELIARLNRTRVDPTPLETSPQNFQMVFVVPPVEDFLTEAQRYADWKTTKGVNTVIISNYSLYDGRDTQEKIRTAIRDVYARSPKLEHVLLMGDTDYLPTRYVYNDDSVVAKQPESVGSPTLKPTDLYYADMSARTWDDNNNNVFGESALRSSIGVDEIPWEFQLYLGRFPAASATELGAMINKSLDYDQATFAGEWMDRVLIGSAIMDPSTPSDPDGEAEAILGFYLEENVFPAEMRVAHLWEAPSGFTPKPTSAQALTRTSFIEHLNLGPTITVFAGHGGPTKLTNYGGGSTFLQNSDVAGLVNQNQPTMLFASACTTNAYDMECLGKEMVKSPTAGAIGYIGCARVSWYYPDDYELIMLNRGVTRHFFESMFWDGYTQQGVALMKSKENYVAEYHKNPFVNFTLEWERKIVLSYQLLGDPEIDIFTQVPEAFQAPFTDDVYAGKDFLQVLRQTDGTPVPFGRVCIQGQGYYNTYQADRNGYVMIRLPREPGEYTYFLTGHNMHYSSGEFTVIADDKTPIIQGEPLVTPTEITVDVAPRVALNVTDAESGVAEAYLVLTQDGYLSFEQYALAPPGTGGEWSLQLPRLFYGDYQGAIVAFDYGNNSISTGLFPAALVFAVQAPPVKAYAASLGWLCVAFIALPGVTLLQFPKKAASATYFRRETTLIGEGSND